MINLHKRTKAIFLIGIILSLQFCSSNKEKDLSKWVGNYFYGYNDKDHKGIILTISSVGNSITGTLSNGTDPELHVDEDGKVRLGKSVATFLNDTTIRLTYVYDLGDTSESKIHRMSDKEVASMKTYNERVINEIMTLETVKIGSQEWMATDLKITNYSNGDPVQEAESPEEWAKCNADKVGCWCYFNNDKNQNVLYNWYAVTDPRGLAPKGWRVPSFEDFRTLAEFLGGFGDAGSQMKNESFNMGYNGSGNSSKFNAIGEGYRQQGWVGGEFRGKSPNGVASLVFYWTTTPTSDVVGNISPRTVGLYNDSGRLDSGPVGASITAGLSVRCIKNDSETEGIE